MYNIILEIEYNKNIKGIYYNLKAEKNYTPDNIRDLEDAIKTVTSLITENNACITVHIKESLNFYETNTLYSRFYNFYGNYGHLYKISENATNSKEDLKLTEIKKRIKNDLTNAFETALFKSTSTGVTPEKISYRTLLEAFNDIDKIDSLLWKHNKGLIKTDANFIYQAYIYYILHGERNTGELKHLKYLLDYDTRNESPAAATIKKQLEMLPEELTA